MLSVACQLSVVCCLLVDVGVACWLMIVVRCVLCVDCCVLVVVG